jgi:predicted histidine transporter YuiF (NhaC family)
MSPETIAFMIISILSIFFFFLAAWIIYRKKKHYNNSECKKSTSDKLKSQNINQNVQNN